jgi:hypothetical protein
MGIAASQRTPHHCSLTRSGPRHFNHIALAKSYIRRCPEPTGASIDKAQVWPFSGEEPTVLFTLKSEKGMRCGIKVPNPQLPPQL